MSHTSPAVHLVWAILIILLGIFLLTHLWRYDKFRCLKINRSGSGAFKRFMTYSYLISIPLLLVWCLGFAYIKYNQGFIAVPFEGVIPKPYVLWPKKFQNLVYPFYMFFSFAWALEIVTHLEELCFWLFLLNAGPIQPSWFHSKYFYIWASGSVAALVYMPVITTLTKYDVYLCEAYTLLAGAAGSFVLTLGFIPILWNFSGFLRNIQQEGVDLRVVQRLSRFHELNTIRVIFRLCMVGPLLVLGIDGVRPHRHINESMFWTDCLAMAAGVGCVVSSGITLMIFFPRSSDSEIGSDTSSSFKSFKQSEASRSITSRQTPRTPTSPRRAPRPVSVDSYSRRLRPDSSLYAGSETYLLAQPIKKPMVVTPVDRPIAMEDLSDSPTSAKLNHNDLEGGFGGHQVQFPPADALPRITEDRYPSSPLAPGSGNPMLPNSDVRPRQMSTFNPMVYHFRSPIEIVDRPPPPIGPRHPARRPKF